MAREDYDAVVALWRGPEGVVLNESDSREAFENFLRRNSGLSQGLSLVVRGERGIIAAALLPGRRVPICA